MTHRTLIRALGAALIAGTLSWTTPTFAAEKNVFDRARTCSTDYYFGPVVNSKATVDFVYQIQGERQERVERRQSEYLSGQTVAIFSVAREGIFNGSLHPIEYRWTDRRGHHVVKLTTLRRELIDAAELLAQRRYCAGGTKKLTAKRHYAGH